MNINEHDIAFRVSALGKQISDDYADKKDPLVIIGVLNGCYMFLSDLTKRISVPHELDFIRVKSYEDNQQNKLEWIKKWELDLTNKHVILVDDIIDTGNTVEVIRKAISKSEAQSCLIATLIQKQEALVQADYIGFTTDSNSFLVGYGMDNRGYERNLNYIKALE